MSEINKLDNTFELSGSVFNWGAGKVKGRKNKKTGVTSPDVTFAIPFLETHTSVGGFLTALAEFADGKQSNGARDWFVATFGKTAIDASDEAIDASSGEIDEAHYFNEFLRLKAEELKYAEHSKRLNEEFVALKRWTPSGYPVTPEDQARMDANMAEDNVTLDEVTRRFAAWNRGMLDLQRLAEAEESKRAERAAKRAEKKAKAASEPAVAEPAN